MIFFPQQLYVALYFVSDVWHHLYGLSKVVASAFFVDNGFIDAPSGERVGLGGLYARKTFIMSKVKVGFHAINRYVTFAMLVGIEGTRINVDVGVKFLDGNVVASRLQQFTN